MTAEQKPSRLYIPQPFASGDGTVSADRTIIDTISGDTLNFVDGFPSVYSSPKALGGKPVTRGDINAIGHLASVNEFYRRCGGLNTFDPELAMKIGGYPRGAVLEIIEDLDYHKVVSLVDDNMVDFNGDTLTDQQIAAGVTLGSIDGVNWAYCANGTIDSSMVVGSLPNYNWVGGDLVEISTLSSFTAKMNGVLSFEGAYQLAATDNETYQKEDVSVTENGTTTQTVTETKTRDARNAASVLSSPCGFMILCTDDIAHSPQLVKANVIYSRANAGITIGGITYSPSDQAVMEIIKGRRYALYLLCQNCDITGSDFKIKIVS